MIAPAPRPLVVRFGAMGDTVILLALINTLHQRFGTPVDVVSSGSWTRPLLESQPGVGRVYLIRSRNLSYWLSMDQWRLIAELRERGPTATWNCQIDEKSAQLLARGGIPLRLIAPLPSLSTPHIVDQYVQFGWHTPAALAEQIKPCAAGHTGVPLATPLHSPLLLVLPAWRRHTEHWLKQFELAERPSILIQAGNKRTMRWWAPRARRTNTKYWPEAHWAHVLRHLSDQHPTAQLLLLGVRSEARLNRDILQLAGTRHTYNLAGSMPIPRLLALQQMAVGMISVDTGPAHSAAALGCPLVVLFGTADPAEIAPRSPTGNVEVVAGLLCGQRSMLGISVDQVTAAWAKVQARSCHANRALVTRTAASAPRG